MQGTENAGLFLPSLEYGLYLGLGISLIDGILDAWVGFSTGGLEWLGSLTGILLLIYFVKLYRNFMPPFSYAASSVLFYAFFHFLLSLVAAAILKRSTYHG